MIGGGVVGLLTGLFARACGAAEVALADPDPQRLAAAQGLGLTPVADGSASAVERWSTSHWRTGPGDSGADLVFQCRGRASALATALRSLRPQGTIIDLAFYEGGAPELRLVRSSITRAHHSLRTDRPGAPRAGAGMGPAAAVRRDPEAAGRAR
ncbi:zinc-binding dehydrogenase [Modestobacter sp. DSM 44400]|uniref:zinc-binding dehydrogenase n=1 Tax=Modestobacter sp. DSM 44400 TaxID=1550230 RepID=UPI001C31E6B1